MRGIDKRRVIITGGCGSIGSAVARRFLEEGAVVTLADLLPESEGKQFADKLDPERAHYVTCDICDEQSIKRALSRAVELMGGLEIAVSNAGIHDNAGVIEMTGDQWQRVLGINLTGNFMFGRAAADLLKDNALPSLGRYLRGTLIFTGSEAAFRTGEICANYSASKAGLHSVMRTLAAAYAPYRVTCNSVAPGPVESRMQRENEGRYENYRENVEKANPLGRFVTAEEVAGSYAFLASEDAAYITGSTLSIDGGDLL